MVRRSFRLGLRLGLLAGVLVAVVKVVQSRRSSREDSWAPAGSGGGPWPPLQAEPVSPEPPAITVTDRLAPVKKSSTVPVSERRGTPAAPSEPGPAIPPPAPTPPAPAPETTLAAPLPRPASPAPAPPRPTPEARPGIPPPVAADTSLVAPPPPPAPAPETSRAAPPATPLSPRDVVPPMAREDSTAAPTELIPTDAALVQPEPVTTPTRRVRKTGSRRVARQQTAWMEAVGTDCPPSHPVKAKLSSMLYHLPGMVAYKRTRPDRCYADAASAETDGFTRAKR